MPYVIPAILERTQSGLRSRLEAIKPHFTRAQIDVLNNTSVPGDSYADPEYIESLATGLMFEVHLMVAMDTYDLSAWNRPWVDKIIFHIEYARKPRSTIEQVSAWGKQVYIAVNSETNVDAVAPYLASIDGIMFLCVEPGRSGNSFMPQVPEKIKLFHRRHPSVKIEVDGGVTDETLPILLDAGVSEFAVGSYLRTEQIETQLFSLLAIIERYERTA